MTTCTNLNILLVKAARRKGVRTMTPSVRAAAGSLGPSGHSRQTGALEAWPWVPLEAVKSSS